MNTIIFGSGFGLYGYLPTIAYFSQKIFLNKKYKRKLINKKYLKTYNKKIIWFDSLETVIHKIDYIVIAQNPKSQFKTVNKILKRKNNFKHILLEKPISENPNKSLRLIKNLEISNINYSFGFIFEYLNWVKFLNKKNDISIIWKIKKKNFSKSWKYSHSEGGGLIRFYGIHFLKLFYDLNYNKINKNLLTKTTWNFNVQNKKNLIKLVVKFDNKEKFLIKNFDRIILDSTNPFLKPIKKNKLDPRINTLKKYIRDKLNPRVRGEKYSNFVNFWKKVEKVLIKKV